MKGENMENKKAFVKRGNLWVENTGKVKAQDMDTNACYELIGEMVKLMFKDLKSVANSPIVYPNDRINKINGIVRLEYEICDNMFTKYVLTDVVGTIESFLRLVCPLEQREDNNYIIKDKRTGVQFKSFLNRAEVEILREHNYLKITKIEKEAE